MTGREFPPAHHYGNYAQIENGVGMTRYLIDQWEHLKRRLPAKVSPERTVTLVTGTMASPLIEQLAADMRPIENLHVRVLSVVNTFFGPEVTVAGLLCGQDVLDVLKAQENLGDLILLSRVMLDNEGVRFLDDVTVEEFRQQLEPVRVEFVRNAPETIDAIRLLNAEEQAKHRSLRNLVRVQSRL